MQFSRVAYHTRKTIARRGICIVVCDGISHVEKMCRVYEAFGIHWIALTDSDEDMGNEMINKKLDKFVEDSNYGKHEYIEARIEDLMPDDIDGCTYKKNTSHRNANKHTCKKQRGKDPLKYAQYVDCVYEKKLKLVKIEELLSKIIDHFNGIK